MRWLQKILLVVLTLSFCTANAQVLIEPGVGVGRIRMGMSKAEAIKILDTDDYSQRDYSEEMTVFLPDNAEYLETLVPFIIGFDTVVDYNSFPKGYPVYKLYFKSDSLIFLSLTSYNKEKEEMEVFAMEGLKYYDNKNACLQAIQSPYLETNHGAYNGFYIYYEKGVELTFDEDQLRVIYLFPPQENFLSLLGSRRKIIREEVKKLRPSGG